MARKKQATTSDGIVLSGPLKQLPWVDSRQLVAMGRGVVNRQALGLRPPRAIHTLDPKQIKGVAIHYTGNPKDAELSPDDVWRGIQRYHMDGRSYNDIAYNVGVVSRPEGLHDNWDGRILEGRGIWRKDRIIMSAGQGPAGNPTHIAIVVLGGDSPLRRDFSEAAKRSLYALIAAIQESLPQALEVRPHSYFKATSCPGDEIRAWIAAGLPVRIEK